MGREQDRIRILEKSNPARGSVETGRETGTAGGQVPQRREGLTRHTHEREKMLAAHCDIIIAQSLYRKIFDHLSSDTSIEQGGLLLGYEEQHPRWQRPVVVIDRALEAKHTIGNVARLTFTHETWAEFERETDELRERGINRRRVGWYHSHPGHGIFLSAYDLDVCENFRRPTHVALVVDPVNNDGGFFVRGGEGFRSDAVQGFWEWHDLADKSVVRWKSMSVAGGEWEGPLPTQTPNSADGAGATVVAGSSGEVAAASQGKADKSDSPAVAPLFKARDEPDAQTFVERRRGMTLSEVPRWVAVLTLAALLTGIVALGVSVTQMSYTIEEKEKATLENLKTLNEELARLKSELSAVSARVQPSQFPEPITSSTPAANEASGATDELQPADSTNAARVRRSNDDRPVSQSNRAGDRANTLNAGRTPAAPSDTSDGKAQPTPASEQGKAPMNGATPTATPLRPSVPAPSQTQAPTPRTPETPR